MKNLLTPLFLLLSLAGFSQTQKGLHASLSVGSPNLFRDQRMHITVSPELMYMGERFGIGVLYNENVNLYKNNTAKSYYNPNGKWTSVGLKGYARVFSVDELDFSLTGEVDYVTDKLDRKIASDYQFLPAVAVAVPLYGNFGARASYGILFYRQGFQGEPIWKERPTGALTVTYGL